MGRVTAGRLTRESRCGPARAILAVSLPALSVGTRLRSRSTSAGPALVRWRGLSGAWPPVSTLRGVFGMGSRPTQSPRSIQGGIADRPFGVRPGRLAYSARLFGDRPGRLWLKRVVDDGQPGGHGPLLLGRRSFLAGRGFGLPGCRHRLSHAPACPCGGSACRLAGPCPGLPGGPVCRGSRPRLHPAGNVVGWRPADPPIGGGIGRLAPTVRALLGVRR